MAKKKNKRVILVTSCVLAALIVAGSTFAWFSSKDEVTNRLSATANYGVTIAEDFTPPENWVPGQTVDKNVAVVNTGNVDAFVRAWLEGEMTVVNEATGTEYGSFPNSLTDTTDTKMKALGLTKYTGTGNNKVYYKTLSTTETQNADDKRTDNNATTDDDDYSEVKSVQAGGWLAYAAGAFEFTTNEAASYIGSDSNVKQYAANTKVQSSELTNTWTNGVGLAINSDTFTPTATGLYIFRRNINSNSGNTGYDYEYSGYYYDSTNSLYYALKYTPSEHSDYVLDTANDLTVTYETDGDSLTQVKSVVPKAALKVFTADEKVIDTDHLLWKVDKTNHVLTAQYSPDTTYATSAEADFGNDIVVDIQLANVTRYNTPGNAGNTPSEEWSAFTKTVGTYGEVATFYYNNDLEEGDTTAKLVDSVTLNQKVTNKAFLAFDFDLNVFMDSVQVTVDSDGNENFATVSGGWVSDNSNVTQANSNAVVGNPEIDNIIWKTN